MADSTVNDLTAASTLDGTELLYGVQGGADRKVTVTQVRAGLLPLTGGALSGDLVLAGAPTQSLHPASKTYVDSGLSAKAASVHTHVTGDVSGLDTALSGKAASVHTHAASDIASGTVATARLGSGTADGTTFLRGDQTWATPSGGGTIDGSGTAGRGARWTDADTLAAGAVQDDGTRAGVGAAPAAAATLTVKAQTGDTAVLRIEGTGGVIIPKVLFEHAGQVGVAVQGDNTGFQFNNDGEGVTLYVVPGYAEAYIKTHPSSPGRLNFQSHDGSDYVSVFAVKGGKAQLWDGSALVDVSIGAADSAGTGFRTVRVPN